MAVLAQEKLPAFPALTHGIAQIMSNEKSVAPLKAGGSVTAPLTFWEQAAATRWGAYVSEVEKTVILEAHNIAGGSGDAIEVGCEGGRWSKMLAELGWQMTCVDINPHVLAVCQRKIPSAKCVLADPKSDALPLVSNSAGLLLCIEVAPVIDSGWFFPEAARVLRSGGILVVVAWNKLSVRGLTSRIIYQVRGKKTGDFYTRSHSWLRRQLAGAGFQLLRQEGFCWSPFGRASNSSLVPWFVKLERLLRLHRFIALSPWVAIIARKSDPEMAPVSSYRPNQMD